jgi:hypothetical protein
MSNASKAPLTLTPDERKARSERLNTIMWAYVCGAITLLCYVVGYERSFIPLLFGTLGGVLAWQLAQRGEQRHSIMAGALTLGGLLIWATYNWPVVEKLF